MIEFIKSNKLLVVTLILIACGLVSYKVFFLSGDPSQTLTETASDAAASPVSQNLLTVLASLQTIKLDNTIFTSLSFTSLVDFGVEIAKEPAGRDNPFAPYVGIAPMLTASSTKATNTSSNALKLPLGSKK